MPASDPYNPPNPTQKAEQHNQAQFRQQEQQRELQAEKDRENASTVQERQIAPGAIRTGSPQDIAVRQEAIKLEQQQMVEQNVHQIGYSSDQFQQARQDALKSGSFNYASVGYASKGRPASYVNTQGTRITRPQGGITGRGSSESILSNIPEEKTVTIQTPTGQRTVKGEQALIDRLISNYSKFNPPRPTITKSSSGGEYKPQKVTISKDAFDLRAGLADLQGKASESAKSTPSTTEAVPFIFLNPITGIKTVPSGDVAKARGRGASPGTGQKVEIETIYSKGTEQVPSSSVIDVLQFAPFGAFGIKAGSEALRGAGSIAGKTIKTGGEMVPKGIKPPEERSLLDTVKEMFSKPSQQTEKPLEPSMTQVSLGRGTGKMISTGEKEGGIGTGSKPSGKPPGEKPIEKTSQSGKQSLQQIVKEEPKTKSESPLTEKANQEYINKLKEKGQTEEQTIIFIPKPQSTKQRESVVPLITSRKPSVGLVPPITSPKPKQEEKLGIVDLLQLKQGQSQPQKSEQTTIFDTLQVTRQAGKQTPKQEETSITDALSLSRNINRPESTGEPLGGGLGGNPGLLAKVSSNAPAKRNYLGNVPIDDIIGIGKQGELTYKESTIKSRTQTEERRASTGSFVGGANRERKRIF